MLYANSNTWALLSAVRIEFCSHWSQYFPFACKRPKILQSTKNRRGKFGVFYEHLAALSPWRIL